ncbi:MAG TPA: DivIVA domain-containing protein [Nitrospiraceae bacterium]|jgi:cell division initiation protein|nr:DivIVA domain-containing protein [Nitrospiraceae bacterium]
MRLTPLDIQQMVFKTRMRGYDCQEVKHFLEDLAQTVESLNHENGALREKVAATEEQLSALKKAETTLTHTLISTQAMADDMKEIAQRDAALLVKEAEFKAAEILREARQEFVALQREISDIRKQRLLGIERLRSTLRTFERVLEIEEEDEEHSNTSDMTKLTRSPDR